MIQTTKNYIDSKKILFPIIGNGFLLHPDGIFLVKQVKKNKVYSWDLEYTVVYVVSEVDIQKTMALQCIQLNDGQRDMLGIDLMIDEHDLNFEVLNQSYFERYFNVIITAYLLKSLNKKKKIIDSFTNAYKEELSKKVFKILKTEYYGQRKSIIMDMNYNVSETVKGIFFEGVEANKKMELILGKKLKYDTDVVEVYFYDSTLKITHNGRKVNFKGMIVYYNKISKKFYPNII